MSWTAILDAIAAAYLIVAAVLVGATGDLNKLFFKALPIAIAFGLALSAAARYFGWPIQ